ncbi:MAG: ATP-binding protein [Terriglobia bacterium]
MHRLFYKIFLWFWLGIVVVSATLVVSTSLTHSRSEENEHWREKYGLTIDLRAEHAAELFDRAGRRALQGFFGPLERRDPMRDFMFDPSGHEVLGREAPPKVWHVLGRMARVPAGRHRFFPRARIAAEKVTGPSGRAYVLIMTFPPRAVLPASLLQFLFEDIGREGSLRLVAVLVVAAFFCLWLARHITSPIIDLRRAAREIASGRLEARVDDKVASRRDELAQLGQDFNQMAERIDALVATQRRFLADVSHELRSPLARLNVALGLARQPAGDGASEHLNRIERETDRLNKLIGQLLTLARMDSGVDLQRKKVFDLGMLAQEVAADADYEARGRNCAVKLNASVQCMVEGAPEVLRGAVENVVRNAIQHTACGTTIEITMECRRASSEGRAVLRVRDYGRGVGEEELSKLFLPFHRVEDGAGSGSGGAGLGLAITRRALRLYGGNATAANAPGGGLLVTLELPLALS